MMETTAEMLAENGLAAMAVEDWHGCYKVHSSVVTYGPAMKHPAKFAPGLCMRIFDEGLHRGWWGRGDLVGDCFGGVGTGALIATVRGLRWVGVEIEERFVRWAREQFNRQRPLWERCAGWPAIRPIIMEGDSRRFAELIGQSIDGLVCSPPFGETGRPPRDPSKSGMPSSALHWGDSHYGDTPGNIGCARGNELWALMRAVYRQVHAALKPGGVACFVLKDHVSDGAIVPVCDRHARLLGEVGFAPVLVAQAWLVSERTEAGVFGEALVTRKQRKSMFRLLAERKGSPAIDFERVLVVRKSNT